MVCYAVIPAAGKGTRIGQKTPKQFLKIGGKPLLSYTVEAFWGCDLVEGLVVAVPKSYLHKAKVLVDHLPKNKRFIVVEGGNERQESVWNCIKALPEECAWVIVHDGVRPFVSHQLINRIWSAAQETGAAICALPCTDTIKQCYDGYVVKTLPREGLWLVQTPQVFRKSLLIKAYNLARSNQWHVTDDASLVERLNTRIKVVEGERSNIKITTPEDLKLAALLRTREERCG